MSTAPDTKSAAPAATWEQALATLTAPGAAFEMTDGTVRGVPVKLFRNAPPSLREFVESARGKGDATWLVYEDERWSRPRGRARAAASCRCRAR